MAKKPRKVYKHIKGTTTQFRPLTTKAPVQVYNGATGGTDRLSITQQVHEHPSDSRSRRNGTPLSEYEQLLNAIYDGVLITDYDGSIREVNVRAVRNFMVEAESMTGLNVLDLVAGADEKVLSVIHENISDRKYIVLEAVCVRGDETRFPAEIVVNRITRDGEVLLCFFVRDATARKEAEEEVTRMQEEIARVEAAKTAAQTLSAVAYELNDPLQILTCLAELDKRDDYKEQVRRITVILERMREEQSGSNGSAPAVKEERPGTGTPARCDNSTILVVDDDAKVRSMFVRALKMAFPHVKVEVASDGMEAVYKFKDKHHGLILMDVLLPELTGEQAYGRIKQICEQENLECPRFIFCTAFDRSDDLQSIVDESASNICLKKPVAMAEVVREVGRCMGITPGGQADSAEGGDGTGN